MTPATVLVLEPTFSAPGAEAITLDAELTAIDAQHPLLNTLPGDLLGGLESRHARIIRESNRTLLLDLSESGATLRNGEPAGSAPVALDAGDILQFGESLTFRVDAMSASDPQLTRMMTERAPELQLLLTPLQEGGPEAPIAVSDFPFLVSSSDGHFAGYQAALPGPSSYLSRRHAHIYQQDNELLIEDLGSTNGTWVNGDALGDQARPLAHGDEVRFGHRAFSFSVDIAELQPEQADTQRVIPDGTVMISSAGSFLDVYCDDGETAEEPATKDTAAAEPAFSAPDRVSELWRDLRLHWQQWPYRRARQIGLFIALPLLLAGLLLGAVLQDNRPEQVQALLAEGNGTAGLALAVTYADDHPDDAGARELVRTTFEASLLPVWIEYMQAEQPQAALRAVSEHVALAPSMAADRSAELLRWMSELAAFLQPSGGSVVASVASDNPDLRTFAQRWRNSADHHTRLLRRFTDVYPAMAPIHTRAMSGVRAIQGQGADQMAAVTDLHAELASLLEDGEAEPAQARFERFQREHPEVRHLAAFETDLERMLAIAEARRAQALDRFLALASDGEFETPYFRKLGAPISLEQRQAAQAKRLLEQSNRLWREGKLADAVESLASVEDAGPWTGLAAAQRAYYQSLQQGFASLLGQVGEASYPDALIDFYVGLDPKEDAFLRTALADDFAAQRARAAERAETLAAEGAERWATFEQTFQGIGGGLRLENQVSDAFRELASQLTQALDLLQRAHRLYPLLDLEAPAALAGNHQQAVDEVSRQRNALESLRFVLGDDLVRDKLALLPELADE